MNAEIRDFLGKVLASGYIAHLFAIAGFLLAFFLVARLMSEKRAPANTFAWLLVIILVPYVGVPLYLLIGGRKLRRLIKRKTQLHPELPVGSSYPRVLLGGPIAHALTGAGASPSVPGNSLKLLLTGEDEFNLLAKHILEAKHTIHITTFIFKRDETGKKIVELLAQRAREGVKVRVLLDAVGCLISSMNLMNPIRDAGGEVGRFMPVIPFSSSGSANLRNHRKIAIFDHATAILGGRNIAKEYMGPSYFKQRWCDLGAEIKGPAAALLNEVFIADWCFATKQNPDAVHRGISPAVAELVGESELQVVASGPDVKGDPLYEGIVASIQEADKNITIVTPYFIPDEVLLRSLIVKARAGKEVTLIVPLHSNHPITDFARGYYMRELKKAGAKILLYPRGMLHAKAIIVDERVAVFGSANFDLRSLFVNFEVCVFSYSKADVQSLRTWANELMSQCKEAKPERRGRTRLLGSLAEDLSRLLAPLL
jgi:cardiolipin synthase